MVIVGAGALARPDGAALHADVRELADKYNMVREGWNGFNVLQLAASRVGGFDLGFLPGANGLGTRGIIAAAQAGKMDLVWLLGADEIDTKRLGSSFVVYQGHHGDAGAHRADVILPGAAYTEKSGVYVNTEGRPQIALRAAFPPGEAKEDWAIIRAFSEQFGKPLPFDTLMQLRAKMLEAAPVLAHIGQRQSGMESHSARKAMFRRKPFVPVIDNFYMTDPISRASVTMAKCTEEILPHLQPVPEAAE